jgi:hypothetical protein
MQPPHGYGYPVPPPPNRPTGVSTLLIVVLVIGGLMVVGGGACLVGLVAYGAGSSGGPSGVVSSTTAESSPEPTPIASSKPEPMPGPVPKPTATVAKDPPKKKGPRTVDFVCPAGEPPQGIVRAGCMCGSSIYGTACGTGFRDVEATAKGCRFTCD